LLEGIDYIFKQPIKDEELNVASLIVNFLFQVNKGFCFALLWRSLYRRGSWLFRAVTHRVFVVICWCFYTIYRSHLEGACSQRIPVRLLDPWRWDPIGCSETSETISLHCVTSRRAKMSLTLV